MARRRSITKNEKKILIITIKKKKNTSEGVVEGDTAAGELALSRSRDAICVAIGADGGVCVAAFGNLKVIHLPSRRRLSERERWKENKKRGGGGGVAVTWSEEREGEGGKAGENSRARENIRKVAFRK